MPIDGVRPLNQDDANKAAGSNIRILRKQAGMSQEELAFEVDFDQSTLSQVELLGPHKTNWRKLFKLADSLGYVVELKFTPKD